MEGNGLKKVKNMISTRSAPLVMSFFTWAITLMPVWYYHPSVCLSVENVHLCCPPAVLPGVDGEIQLVRSC